MPEIAALAWLANGVGVMADWMLKRPEVGVTPAADTAKVGRSSRGRDNDCGHCRFLDVRIGKTGPVETRVVFLYEERRLAYEGYVTSRNECVGGP